MIALWTLAALPAALCPFERLTIEQAADRIEAAYVLEEESRAIASALRDWATKAPQTAECTDPDAFAKTFTKTLRETSGDAHFFMEKIDTAPKTDWINEWRASGARQAQGITKVEILKGNVGYIRIKSFFEIEAAFRNYQAAFDLVSTTDALILDLRGNGGGSPETAWPVQWTFLEAGSPSPMALESRAEGSEVREEPPVLWERYGTMRPVAVLIDKRTFSASEAVAFTLKITGRAVVLGERSGGGAHMLDGGIALNDGFRLHTPTSRPVSVSDRTNWEATGVTPDIDVNPEDALERALAVLESKIADLAS